ncbi:MAG: hypothetical protein KC646_11215 [Candidatus Cloacimonetes bacterium]|nr:hypothetical protein [Candidatus Cloacimonadota bacterium]
MRYIMILVVLLQNVMALSIPKNNFRGNGLIYTDIVQNDGGFEQLRNYDYKQVYYPTGSIYLDGEFVRKKSITWDTSEKKWLSRYYYNHNLQYKLDPKLQTKLSKDSYESKKIAQILAKEISYYEGKFQNIILDLSDSCHKDLSIIPIKEQLALYQRKLGLKLQVKDIRESKIVFKKTPDFFIFEVDIYDQEKLPYYQKHLSKLNVPYYLSFTMKSSFTLEGQKISLSAEEKGDLILISEEKVKKGIKKLYKVASDNNIKFQKNERITELSPSVMMLNDALNLSEKIDNFWYNGHIIDLNRWSSRLLTREEIAYAPPTIDYLKTKSKKGLELSLNLSNPNPVGTSQYKDQAGIALKLRGYQLKSIDMSAFDNIKAFSMNGDDFLYFTLNSLNAFAKSGTIKLQLNENSDNPQISSVAWIKLPAEVDYLYNNGDFSSRIPEYQLKHFSEFME